MGCGASVPAPAEDAQPGAAMSPAAAKAEERTLKGLFAEIDQDGDGKVTRRELQVKLKADSTIQDLLVKAGGTADYVMDQLDVDGDGFITYKEFEAMLSADANKLAEAVVPGSAAAPPPEATNIEKLKKLFDSIDSSGNSDGKISREELRAHMSKDDTVVALLVAAGGSKDYVFEQLNADDDNFVTWDEFKEMLLADPLAGSEPSKAVSEAAPKAEATGEAPKAMSEEEDVDAILAEAAAALDEK